ncbi:MAG: hypothetical protein MUP98_19925, partial [Candidatus Aminicenantes bacterium]|nr:hypothetical protein [Candidatus Aminicenantes bacterium]
MNKIFAVLSLGYLLLGSAFAVQQEDGLIREIYLIKNPNKTYINAPLEIRIGIDMAAPAYFKLSEEGNFIDAGYLPEGDNSLSIPTKAFFEKTEKHTFSLELKTENRITQKDIILDVQLAVLEIPIKVEAERIISENKLSLFIEDQLVSTRTQKREIIEPIQPDLSVISGSNDPFYVPKETDDLMSNRVSIIDALLMGYQLIKTVAKKKDREEPALPLQHTHSL